MPPAKKSPAKKSPAKKSRGKVKDIGKITSKILVYIKEANIKDFTSRMKKAVELMKYVEKNLDRLEGNNLINAASLAEDMKYIDEIVWSHGEWSDDVVDKYEKAYEIWKNYANSAKGKNTIQKLFQKDDDVQLAFRTARDLAIAANS